MTLYFWRLFLGTVLVLLLTYGVSDYGLDWIARRKR